MARRKKLKSLASEPVPPHLTRYNGRYNEKYRGLPAEIRLMTWKLIAPDTRLHVKEVVIDHNRLAARSDWGLHPNNRDPSPAVYCRFDEPPDLSLLHLDRTIRAETLPLHRFIISLVYLQTNEVLKFFFRLPPEVSHLIQSVSIGHKMLTRVLQDEKVRTIQDLDMINVTMNHSHLHLFKREIKTFLNMLGKADEDERDLRDARTKTVVIHGTPWDAPDQRAEFESEVSGYAASAGYDAVISHRSPTYAGRRYFVNAMRLRYRISLSKSKSTP